MESASGRCLCGAVRFQADGVKMAYHVCHCGMCRRWSGGPFMAASAERVSFKGERNLARFASSEWAERGFCKTCGTNLFYYLKPADTYAISVGAFDDPTPFRLVGEIYIDSKPDGYAFAGDLPKQTEAEFLAQFAPPGSGAN